MEFPVFQLTVTCTFLTVKYLLKGLQIIRQIVTHCTYFIRQSEALQSTGAFTFLIMCLPSNALRYYNNALQ